MIGVIVSVNFRLGTSLFLKYPLFSLNGHRIQEKIRCLGQCRNNFTGNIFAIKRFSKNQRSGRCCAAAILASALLSS